MVFRSGLVLICFFLAAVFLIGIGPKSLEVQNEAVHPIGFIRLDCLHR
jgi:hypothetical protein